MEVLACTNHIIVIATWIDFDPDFDLASTLRTIKIWRHFRTRPGISDALKSNLRHSHFRQRKFGSIYGIQYAGG